MISKLLYTFWTNKGTNFLCGFATEDTFLAVFSESLKKSKEYFKEVEIYTDVEGEKYLKSKGFDVKTVVVDYDLYNFNKGYWNFPKLITYSLQTENFLHIDMDLVLDTEPKNLDQDFICEMHRIMAPQPYGNRQFLGKVICDNYTPRIVCSGILGGKSNVFKTLFTVASEIVKVPGPVTFDMMFSVEEIVLTALLKINRIESFAIDGKFTHYQGSNAKQRLVEKKEFTAENLIID